jgi:tellurite resistance protein TehA-like permease
MRRVFVVLTFLLAASAALQLYFAAVGVFSSDRNDPFALHTTNGRIVLPILVLLTIAAAALARAGARIIRLTVLEFVLLVFQTLFVLIPALIFGVEPLGDNVPAVATALMALHGINGGVIVAISGTLVERSLSLARTAPENQAPSPVEVDTVPRA